MSERPDRPKIIPVTPADAPAPDGIARRAVLQTLLGGVGAGLALPSVVEAQHPVQHHLASATGVEQAQKKAAVAAYKAEFFDAHQLKTLEVLAEAIVPGSTTAKVAPFLDQLIAVESAQNQRAILGALGAFDMAAIEKHGKAWKAITAAEQDALLQEASTAEAGKSKLRSPFQNLKGWIAGRVLLVGAGHARAGLDRQRVPHRAARLHSSRRTFGVTRRGARRAPRLRGAPLIGRVSTPTRRRIQRADDEVRCDRGGVGRLGWLGGQATVGSRHQGGLARSGQAAGRQGLHRARPRLRPEVPRQGERPDAADTSEAARLLRVPRVELQVVRQRPRRAVHQSGRQAVQLAGPHARGRRAHQRLGPPELSAQRAGLEGQVLRRLRRGLAAQLQGSRPLLRAGRGLRRHHRPGGKRPGTARQQVPSRHAA